MYVPSFFVGEGTEGVLYADCAASPQAVSFLPHHAWGGDGLYQRGIRNELDVHRRAEY